MRNLKRALSLALASIMLLGMMVVGAGAKGLDDFSDAAEITNKDAVAITSAIGIFDGYETGDFRPDRVVTRGEMAVVISKILYGAKVDVSQFAGQSMFTDVPAWAEGYVNLCASLGIVAGYGDGKFGTNDTVTTAQAALMLCRAAGYFQNEAELGDSWSLAATAKANGLGLYDGLTGLGVNEGLNRDNVAGMVFNTLTKVSTVEYNPTFNMYYTTGHDFANGVKFSYRETLGYKNFSLVYMKAKEDDFGRPCTVWGTGSLNNVSLTDKGDIPDTYSGIAKTDVIIEAVNEADHSWTGKVSQQAMYNAVGRNVRDNYRWTVYVDGQEVDGFSAGKIDKDETGDDFLNNNGTGYDLYKADSNVTGNGVLTQVYIDTNARTYSENGQTVKVDGTVIVSVSLTYVAEIYRVTDGAVRLSKLDEGPVRTSDEFEATGFSVGDIVYYTYSRAAKDIQSVGLAEKVEGEVTRVKANNADSNGDNFVVDGTTYSYNKTVSSNEPRRLITENVSNNVVAYKDNFGYIIYIDDSAATYKYAYVLSCTAENDKWGGNSQTYNARLVLTDGTLVKTEVKSTKAASGNPTSLVGHLVSYTIDSNKVYALTDKNEFSTYIADKNKNYTTATELEIRKGRASFKADGKSYTTNENTVFIVGMGSITEPDDMTFSVYTGFKNVPDIGLSKNANGNTTIVAGVADNKGITKTVFVASGSVSGGDVYFVEAQNGTAKKVNEKDGSAYFEFKAFVDGESVTLKVKEGEAAYDTLNNTVFTEKMGVSLNDKDTKRLVAARNISYDSNGLVVGITLYDDQGKGDLKNYMFGAGQIGTDRRDGNTIGLGATYDSNGNAKFTRYAWTSEAEIARYDDGFKVESANGITRDYNDEFLAVMDDGVLSGICIIEHKGTEAPVTYKVTVKVNGTEDATLTKTVKEGATYTGTYTLAENHTGSYKVDNGTAVALKTGANELKLENVKANHTIDITTKEITGKTVTFNSRHYPAANYEFYVNGTKLTDADFAKDGAMYSFNVESDDVIEIVEVTGSNFNATKGVFVDDAGKVEGRMDQDAKTVSFSTDTAITLQAPRTMAGSTSTAIVEPSRSDLATSASTNSGTAIVETNPTAETKTVKVTLTKSDLDAASATNVEFDINGNGDKITIPAEAFDQTTGKVTTTVETVEPETGVDYAVEATLTNAQGTEVPVSDLSNLITLTATIAKNLDAPVITYKSTGATTGTALTLVASFASNATDNNKFTYDPSTGEVVIKVNHLTLFEVVYGKTIAEANADKVVDGIMTAAEVASAPGLSTDTNSYTKSGNTISVTRALNTESTTAVMGEGKTIKAYWYPDVNGAVNPGLLKADGETEHDAVVFIGIELPEDGFKGADGVTVEPTYFAAKFSNSTRDNVYEVAVGKQMLLGVPVSADEGCTVTITWGTDGTAGTPGSLTGAVVGASATITFEAGSGFATTGNPTNTPAA